jgi:hypothetical protein
MSGVTPPLPYICLLGGYKENVVFTYIYIYICVCVCVCDVKLLTTPQCTDTVKFNSAVHLLQLN